MPGAQSRVMFVTNSLTGGGAERATNILVNGLTKIEITSCLVTVNDSPPDLVIPQCEVFELKRPWQGDVFTVLKAFKELQMIIRRWKPDVIVLNCDIPELLGAFTLGKHRLVIVEHASRPWPQRTRLGLLVRKILAFRKSKWVAVSNHLSIWGIDKSPDAVINNPVELEIIATSSKYKTEGSHAKFLAFIGRLSPEKNPQALVDAAISCGLPLKFIGSGNEELKIRASCESNSINSEFFGFVKNPWLEINEEDLVIIPSNNEGDGLVLIEALINRVPILVKRIPDLSRFELNDINYYSTREEMLEKIEIAKLNLTVFKVDDDISKQILKNRDPKVIAMQWRNFLLTAM